MPAFKMTLCYDGTRYRGWQKQGNTPDTLQEKLESTLSRLLSQPIEINGCGRTDAGVHARMQVCSFRAETDMKCSELMAALNRYLPEDIGCIDLQPVPPRFHARLSCREKTYVYRVWTGKQPDVFERKYRFTFTEPLDTDKMASAAAYLTGTHDYRAFTTAAHMKKSTVRTVSEIRIEKEGNELRFIYTGNGFLYNMVRILTGTLLEVGTGKREPEEMPLILESENRSAAGFTAPPHGLFLWNIVY